MPTPPAKYLRDAALEQQLRELKAEHVDKHHTWYVAHTSRPKVLYRLTGVVIIVGSVSLPFLSNLPENHPAKVWLLPGLSLAIAICGGLAGFYNWQTTWQKNFLTRLEIERASAAWEMDLLQAGRGAPNEEIKSAIAATRKLLDHCGELVKSESEAWFARLEDAAALAQQRAKNRQAD